MIRVGVRVATKAETDELEVWLESLSDMIGTCATFQWAAIN